MSKDLRGTWKQAILSIATPLLFVLIIRWILIEPFVIPSGSMIPNLLVNDHIMVQKSSYGFRFPFTKSLWLWSKPQRGDVVVFRYPSDPNTYFVKRLVGLPNDKIELKDSQLFINGQKLDLKQKSIKELDYLDTKQIYQEDEYLYFQENSQYVIRYLNEDFKKNFGPIEVPKDSYFMMGDNRDQSSDSRVWGVVPQNLLVGKVWFIWLSCDEMLPNAQFLCDPQTIRWTRLFKSVK